MSSTVIVGSGPAGISVANRLADAGHSVVLIDEWNNIGGSLNWEESSRQSESLRTLRDELAGNPMIDIRAGSVVWAAFPNPDGFELMLNTADQATSLVASNVVLATGTTDVVSAWPGSTLPGVMTERAFRILVSKHGVVPGDSIALVGGATSGRLAAEVVRWKLGSRITNVSAKWLESINGTESVESLSLSNGTTVVANTVVLSLGEAPDLQLAGMLEIATRFDPVRRSWFAADSNPLPGLYLAGGALLGQATYADVVQSAETVAAAIIAGGTPA